MLTRLRFKNWRSLRDVEINDLTPLTVFIGANSSGKTNILDGLHFLRYANTNGNRGVVGAVYKWRGRERIHTQGVDQKEPVELEFSYLPRPDLAEVTRSITLQFSDKDVPLTFSSLLKEGTEVLEKVEPVQLPLLAVAPTTVFRPGDRHDYGLALSEYTHTFITRRWQLLGEGFMPPISLAADSDPGDFYLIEPNARNLPFILDFMRQVDPDLYNTLQDDFRWLLNHVDTLETARDEQETRLFLREKVHKDEELPSVSAGTARILAMLTAFYALNLDASVFETHPASIFREFDTLIANMPGLVVIEEPDTALNPGVLRNFVEQLRYYTTGDKPRQFILTTHNPAFLDYFEPVEVRVVTRDEAGYTTVSRISDDVRKIWLDEYGLGEVWLTNSFGGLP